MVITWKNIGQSDTNAGSAAMRTGGEYLNKGLKRLEEEALGVSARAKDKWDIGSQENTDAMISNIRAISNLDDYNAAVAAGTFGDAAGKAQYGHQVDMGQVRTALEQRDDDIFNKMKTGDERELYIKKQNEVPIMQQFDAMLLAAKDDPEALAEAKEFLNVNRGAFVDPNAQDTKFGEVRELQIGRQVDSNIAGNLDAVLNGSINFGEGEAAIMANVPKDWTMAQQEAVRTQYLNAYAQRTQPPKQVTEALNKKATELAATANTLRMQAEATFAREVEKAGMPPVPNADAVYNDGMGVAAFVDQYGVNSESWWNRLGGSDLKSEAGKISTVGVPYTRTTPKGEKVHTLTATPAQIKFAIAHSMDANGIWFLADAGVVKDDFYRILAHVVDANLLGKAEAKRAEAEAKYQLTNERIAQEQSTAYNDTASRLFKTVGKTDYTLK